MAHADDAPTFIGSRIKTEDAVSKSDAVFIGKITKVGFISVAAPNESSYVGTEVMVSEALKGSSKGRMTVRLHRVYPEQALKAGDFDIFFVTGATVLKLLPATDGNIATVKNLIAQLPAK